MDKKNKIFITTIFCIIISFSILIFLETKPVSAAAAQYVLHVPSIGCAPKDACTPALPLPEFDKFKLCRATTIGSTTCTSNPKWLSNDCDNGEQKCNYIIPEEGKTITNYIGDFVLKRNFQYFEPEGGYYDKTNVKIQVKNCAQECYFCDTYPGTVGKRRKRCEATILKYFENRYTATEIAWR